MKDRPHRADAGAEGVEMQQLPPSERLAAVLAAATAPAEPEELAGEEAALTAFRGMVEHMRARRQRPGAPVQAP